VEDVAWFSVGKLFSVGAAGISIKHGIAAVARERYCGSCFATERFRSVCLSARCTWLIQQRVASGDHCPATG